MKNRINEHDMTKKMMEIMRGGYKGLLKEDLQDGQTQMEPSSSQINPSDLDQEQIEPTPTDVIELKQGDAAFNDELTKMSNAVSPTIVFTDFNIYPSDGNVVIDGYLEKQESKDSGIFFKMSVTSDIETSMVDVELDDDINEALKRLTGYSINFKEEWGKKVYREYRKIPEN